MAYIVNTERVSKDLAIGLSQCSNCSFSESQAKDATAGGFIFKGGVPVKGRFEKAILSRPGVETTSTQVERRNVNDFIRHVPVGILAKGTRLFHVSASADWVSRSVVGSNNPDGYSFFTPENKGFAGMHGNNFASRILMQLTQDVHCFFFNAYDIHYWYPQEVRYFRKSQTEIKDGHVRVGGELAEVVVKSWPSQYRPVAWAGCLECELVFHSSVIPSIMTTVAIAKSTNNFRSKTVLDLGQLPPAMRTEGNVGIHKPWWMSPLLHSRRRVNAAEARFRTNNIPLEPGFFD